MCHLFPEPEKLVAKFVDDLVNDTINDIINLHHGYVVKYATPHAVVVGGLQWRHLLATPIGDRGVLVRFKDELEKIGLVMELPSFLSNEPVTHIYYNLITGKPPEQEPTTCSI